MPSLTLTYDGTLSRVRCVAASLPSGAESARFERSVDGVRWTIVRGGGAVPIVSNGAAVDDYEFTAGTVNYYRVKAVDDDAMTFVAAGTADSDNNASLTPGLPAGWAEGDLLLVLAAIRNSGTGTVDTPAGYLELASSGNVALLGKRATASESGPTVTFTGGAAGADTIAQMAAFRNAELEPATWEAMLNVSAQDIAYPSVVPPLDDCTVLLCGWKQDDWTSVATVDDFTEIGETDSTAGSDAGIVWDYQIQTDATGIPTGSFDVTDGASAISRALAVVLRKADALTTTTAAISPGMHEAWLKFPRNPGMNQRVTLLGWGEHERSSRSGVFDVTGRPDPVVVGEVHSSRQVTVQLWAPDDDAVKRLDDALAVGQTCLLHLTPDCALKSTHAVIGDYRYVKPAARSHRAHFAVTLREIAAPDPEVTSPLGSWASVLNLYVDWRGVESDLATWQDVLDLEGTAQDMVTVV